MRMISCDNRDAVFVDVFKRTALRAGYQLDMVRPGTMPPAGFDRLLNAYRHLSPNPPAFELASFRRWFEIRDVVAADERFVLADSDLVIFSTWDELSEEVRSFGGIVGSIGATDDVLEEGINGGFSVWTGQSLDRFCEYMVECYEIGTDRLLDIHRARVAAGNPRAAISDMTLLYQWVKEEDVPFLNTNRLFKDRSGEPHYIDHNFFMPQALGVRFATTLGRKSLRFENERAFAANETGERILVDSLHLGGRYKIMAADIENGNQAAMAAKSAYIVAGRTARTVLGRLGIQR